VSSRDWEVRDNRVGNRGVEKLGEVAIGAGIKLHFH